MIIGVAGTAKNTGKTTTLCTMIRTARAMGRLPGITGIGYDGEERDTVTLLPKPRITVFPGMLVTTSERCLEVSTARMRVLDRTGLQTALGKVVITIVEEEGLAVVAGPNKTSDLHTVTRRMGSSGATDLFVDGSLNRIAPMAVADRVVFATGGARSTNIAHLAEEMAAIEWMFQEASLDAAYGEVSGIRLVAGEVQIQCASSQFHSPQDIGRALQLLPGGLTEIVLPGMVSLDGLTLLGDRVEQAGVAGLRIVFDNPFRLLLAGEPNRLGEWVERMRKRSISIGYRHRTKLAAVTFNPYYPAFDGTTYSAAYLDASSGKAALSAALTTPVIDVVEEGVERLYECCFSLPPSLVREGG
jgi:hypothetical protein